MYTVVELLALCILRGRPRRNKTQDNYCKRPPKQHWRQFNCKKMSLKFRWLHKQQSEWNLNLSKYIASWSLNSGLIDNMLMIVMDGRKDNYCEIIIRIMITTQN